MSAPDATPSSPRLTLAAGLSLGLLLVGVEVHELFATVGGWLAVVVGVAVVASRPGARAELTSWWPLGAYLAWSLVGPTLLGAPPRGTGVARLLDAVFVPAAAWVTLAASPRALRRVGVAVSLVLLGSCALAGAQHLGWWPPLETFSDWSWTHLPFERVYETVPGRDDRFMGGGLLLHRLKFANVTSALTVLAAATALKVTSPARWWFVAVAFVGFASVVTFPHARAAAVSLMVALAVVALVGAQRRALGVGLVAGLGLVAALLLVAMPSVRTRFGAAFEQDGASDRVMLRAAGLKALEAAPLSGTGLGRFKPGDWLPDDAPEGLRAHQGKSHNQLLTIAVEAGVPALLLFVAVLALLGAWAVRRLPGSLGALGVLTLFIGLSVLHDPLFHPESSMALFASLGVGLGLSRRPE